NLLEGRVVEALPQQQVVVECAGVRLRCRSAVQVPVGAPATLSLRYERVGIANGAPNAVVIPSRVTDRTFLGSSVRITARSASGLSLVADIADVERAGPLQVGSPVE